MGRLLLLQIIEPMPEICQNAAVYFDPFNPRDIAEKMQIVLSNNDLLQKLKQISLIRASIMYPKNWTDK